MVRSGSHDWPMDGVFLMPPKAANSHDPSRGWLRRRYPRTEATWPSRPCFRCGGRPEHRFAARFESRVHVVVVRWWKRMPRSSLSKPIPLRRTRGAGGPARDGAGQETEGEEGATGGSCAEIHAVAWRGHFAMPCVSRRAIGRFRRQPQISFVEDFKHALCVALAHASNGRSRPLNFWVHNKDRLALF